MKENKNKKVHLEGLEPQYNKMLTEAAELNCLDEAIKMVAILKNKNSLINYRYAREHDITYASFVDPRTAARSDLLSEVDIYNQICSRKFPNLIEAGIHKKSFLAVKSTVAKLRGKLKKQGFDVYARSNNIHKLIHVIFTGTGEYLYYPISHLNDSESCRIDVDKADPVISYDNSFLSEIMPERFRFVIGQPKEFESGRKILQFRTGIHPMDILGSVDPDEVESFEVFNSATRTVSDFPNFTTTDHVKYKGIDILSFTYTHTQEDDEYFELYEKYKNVIEGYLRDYEHLEDLRENILEGGTIQKEVHTVPLGQTGLNVKIIKKPQVTFNGELDEIMTSPDEPIPYYANSIEKRNELLMNIAAARFNDQKDQSESSDDMKNKLIEAGFEPSDEEDN